MSRTKCKSCSGWMFSGAVDCPHCGANQLAGDPLLEGLEDPSPEPEPPQAVSKPKPVSVSSEEARSLTQLGAAGAAPPVYEDTRPGMVSWLFLPQTMGARRGWEIALTIVAAPLMALTIFTVGWWSVRYRMASTVGMARIAVPVSAAALFCFAMAFGLSAWPAGIGLGCMLLAWLVREMIRYFKHDPFL